jgi:hypothetical protein
MSSVLKATIHANEFIAGGPDIKRDIVVVWHKHLPLGLGVNAETPGYTIEARTAGYEPVILDRANHAAPALRVATREAIRLWEEADEACLKWQAKLRKS